MKAKSKRQQNVAGNGNGNGNGIDRISSLPDSILCHILSFLPTKDAVATSVLSHSWRHLWKYVPVLNFNDNALRALPKTHSPNRFADFVNRVLRLHKTPRHIRKFRLQCGSLVSNSVYPYSVPRWVRSATGPHLQELELKIYLYYAGELSSPLPLSVFTCNALASMSLCGQIHVEQLSSVRLPCLKVLKLDIFYMDSNSVEALFLGCPVLEALDLSFHHWGTFSAPKICLPSSIKSLHFYVPFGDRVIVEDLEIHTPSLEYLNFISRIPCTRFSVTNLHNVVKAYLEFDAMVNHIDTVLKLIRALSRTTHLVLRDSSEKCLGLGPLTTNEYQTEKAIKAGNERDFANSSMVLLSYCKKAQIFTQ